MIPNDSVTSRRGPFVKIRRKTVAPFRSRSSSNHILLVPHDIPIMLGQTYEKIEKKPLHLIADHSFID